MSNYLNEADSDSDSEDSDDSNVLSHLGLRAKHLTGTRISLSITLYVSVLVLCCSVELLLCYC